MTKKEYKVPTLRTIKLSATAILADSGSTTPIGEIGGDGPEDNDNYDIIGGYGEGGWGTGSPD